MHAWNSRVCLCYICTRAQKGMTIRSESELRPNKRKMALRGREMCATLSLASQVLTVLHHDANAYSSNALLVQSPAFWLPFGARGTPTVRLFKSSVFAYTAFSTDSVHCHWQALRVSGNNITD